MANENIQQEGQENPEEPKHHSSWIKDMLAKIDTDFPLSGNEQEEDFEDDNDDQDEDIEDITETKEKPHKKTTFFEDLDTEFPLSGGEVER